MLLVGRLITHTLGIGCYDYWCAMRMIIGIVFYCVSCLLGWAFLGY